jgi:hypothetical protein
VAERYLIHRKVNYPEDWMHTLSAWSRGCMGIISALVFFAVTPPGRRLFRAIVDDIRTALAGIDFSPFLKPFLLMSGIYLAGLTSIIRADFSYIDDIARAVEGYHGWNSWSRHLSDILSTFINADPHLTDISPLPQIIAALLLACSSVLLVYIIGDRKNKRITLPALLASIPVGLSPYFLENMSYKFDAPYMGLSVLFSVIPFLFIESKRAFIFSSIVSLLVMCMTYQASSGVYLLITMLLSFHDWNQGRKTGGEIAAFAGSAAISFCGAMVIFRLLFMVNGSTGHGVSTAVLPLGGFIPGVLHNIATYAASINQDFGIIWKVLIAFLAVLFIIRAGALSTRRKALAAFVAALVLVALFIMSYGVYLILERPLFYPRALYGSGIALAIIGIYLVSSRSRLAAVSAIALSWCFFVFAFSYGNALADQKRYTAFRLEMALRDLSASFPDRKSDEMTLLLENGIGFSSLTENAAKHYPLIKRLVPDNRHYHLYRYLVDYFHWGKGEEDAPVDGDLTLVFDSYYHTIQSDGKRIILIFKH